MIVPGLFSYKVKGRKDKLYRWAITRLYVLRDESTCNGASSRSLALSPSTNGTS